MPKNGDLQVWWIPQVPCKSFNVAVSSVQEAALVIETLANYDLFQLENKIKPDYCNAGGLQVWEDDYDGDGNSGWCDWYDEMTGIDDPFEYIEYLKETHDNTL